jgi:hypothetical protein
VGGQSGAERFLWLGVVTVIALVTLGSLAMV